LYIDDAAKVHIYKQNTKSFYKNRHKSRIPQFFDVYQKKVLFPRTVYQNPLPDEKIAVPLHRQKEQKALRHRITHYY
jgi:hypothetical protein